MVHFDPVFRAASDCLAPFFLGGEAGHPGGERMVEKVCLLYGSQVERRKHIPVTQLLYTGLQLLKVPPGPVTPSVDEAFNSQTCRGRSRSSLTLF